MVAVNTQSGTLEEEAERFLENEAYHRVLGRMRAEGAALWTEDETTFTIGPASEGEAIISKNPDGTLGGNDRGLAVTMRAGKDNRSTFTFKKALKAMQGRATTNLYEHWRSYHGGYEGDTKKSEQRLIALGISIAAELCHGRMINPDAVGYARLREFIGPARMNEATRIFGVHATVADLNLIQQHRATVEEALSLSPNGLIYWRRTRSQDLYPTPMPETGRELTAEAKATLERQWHHPGTNRNTEEAWRALGRVSTAALKLRPPVYPGLQTLLKAVMDSGTPATYTATLNALRLRKPHTGPKAQIWSQYLKESQRRHKAGGRAGTQKELTAQLEQLVDRDRWDTERSEEEEKFLDALEAGSAWPEAARQLSKQAAPAKAKRAKVTPDSDSRERITVMENAAQAADGEIGDRVLELAAETAPTVSGGRSHASLRVPREREPRLTITRSAGGHLQLTGNGYRTDNILLPAISNGGEGHLLSTRGLAEDLAKKAILRTLEEFVDRLPEGLNPSRGSVNRFHRVLRERRPEYAHAHSDERLSKELAQAVARLTEPGMTKVLDETGTEPTAGAYNTIVNWLPFIGSLRTGNPGALTWAIKRPSKTTATSRHPGQLISDVRAQLEAAGMRSSCWHRFTTSSPETVTALAKLEPAEVAAVLNATRGRKLELTAEMVRAGGYIAERAATSHTGRITPPETLERAVALALTAMNTGNDGRRSVQQYSPEVTDYLPTLNGPLNATTWNGLVKEQEAWHRQQRTQRRRQQRLEELEAMDGEYVSWKSAIDQAQIDEYTFVALTDALTLHTEGDTMDHCVGSYWRSCSQGEVRIFRAQSAGQNVGTVELRNSHGAWVPGQARGYQNAGIPDSLQEAAGRLSELYQRKEMAATART